MQQDGERWYSVTIETWGDGADSVDNAALEELGPILVELGGSGAVASAGGNAGGPGATFALSSREPLEPYALGDVAGRASDLFITACEKAGLPFRGIARIDVMEQAYLDRMLEEEPERYAGVSEVAEILGVSRQRVSELRTREDFPAPLAELAAGPVWTVSSLRRFLRDWPRRPGRPKRAAG